MYYNGSCLEVTNLGSIWLTNGKSLQDQKSNQFISQP